MNNEHIIPNDSVYDLPSFDILSDGKEINAGYQVFSVVIQKIANRIPTAKIIIRDGDVSEGTFEVSDAEEFVPGKKIEVKAGLDGNNETVFKGLVVKQKIKITESGNSMLCVHCVDEAFKFTLGRKNKYFIDIKDKDAIKEILGGAVGTVDDTKVTHPELIQHYMTDWDFIVSRAEANAQLVFVELGKVNVKTPVPNGSAVIKLGLGGNVLELEAEMDARYQWDKVEAKSWDYSTQQEFKAEAKGDIFTKHGDLKGSDLAKVGELDVFELRHGGHVLEDELRVWAEGCLMKSRLARIRGHVKFSGFAPVKLGELASLEGSGNHFNGLVYVTGVRYEFVDGAIYTDLQFGLSPQWFHEEYKVIDTPGAGLMGAVKGLQIGKVIRLEGDPEGEDRIMVTLPTVDISSEGTWVRLGTLDAGNMRGWVIRPEIGDEVIVGFLNGDIRDGIVLGRLHSTANPAPIPAADENHIKGYTSRSKMRLEFDDEKKIITIDTPAGNSIVISEEDEGITIVDQNGNECKMDPSGIAIKSIKDFSIEAPGEVSIKSTGGDMTMEAINITAKGQASFKAEGGSGAELLSGGQTVVKGSIVMIN